VARSALKYESIFDTKGTPVIAAMKRLWFGIRGTAIAGSASSSLGRGKR
jgi:hypothetical protein